VKDNTDLVQSLKNQLQNCAGFEGDELSKHRTESLNYYFQRARGDEVPGRSRVVAGDESAMVEANLAQMMDGLTSTSTRVVDYRPLGAADKEQAALETDTVTYFVMEANNGWVQLSSAIKDALQLRNGIMKTWIETRKVVRYETYANVKSAEAVAELTDRPDATCKMLNKWTPEKGLLSLRCQRTVKRFRCEAVALENFLYPKDWDSHDLQEIPICAERHIDTRAEMKALGFPAAKVDKLTATRTTGSTLTGAARNPASEAAIGPRPIDKSLEQIEWYEIYVLHDGDGDGIAERRRMSLAYRDSELLADVPVNLVPYAAGVVLLNQHRLTGIDLHDKLKQTQDKHTALERVLFDGLNSAIKNRTATLDGAVNPDDLADGRVNGNIRVNRRMVSDVRMAVTAFSIPDTSANVLENIREVKAERSEMGGAALDMASGNMQLNERMGSEGVDRVYSVMEQLAALMTRNIAQTLIRNTWLLAHATLREGWNEASPIQASIQWQNVPAKWAERLCVAVKPGMSPGERARLQNAIAKLIDWQVMLAEKGMDEVLVYLDGFFKALMDWARVAEVPFPEQYFRNPASKESQTALDGKRKQAKQMEEQKQMLMRQAIGLEQLRTAVEKYAGDADRQFKYWAKVMDVEVEEAKLVGHATTELLKAKQQPNEDEDDGANDGARGAEKGSSDTPAEPVAA